MKKFIVIRYGSNSANQSMCPRAVVGVVLAHNEESARETAEAEWTCYNNQHFEFLRPSEASYADKRDAAECEPINRLEQEKQLDAKLAD